MYTISLLPPLSLTVSFSPCPSLSLIFSDWHYISLSLAMSPSLYHSLLHFVHQCLFHTLSTLGVSIHVSNILILHMLSVIGQRQAAPDESRERSQLTYRCRANSGQIRQPRPDYGVVLQVKVLGTLQDVPTSLVRERIDRPRPQIQTN